MTVITLTGGDLKELLTHKVITREEARALVLGGKRSHHEEAISKERTEYFMKLQEAIRKPTRPTEQDGVMYP